MLYLSNVWFEAANDALKQMQPLATDFAIKLSVLKESQEAIDYTITLGPEQVTFDFPATEADTALSTNWETAVAISQGVYSAQQAFLEEKLTIKGDILGFIEHAKTLAKTQDHLQQLRSKTSYGTAAL